GVMLYEMLAGVLPFQADTPVALLHQHVASPPPPLRERVPGIPKSLEKIVMRALAKNPDDRYATASEFADALEVEATGQRRQFGLRLGRKETPMPTPTPGGVTNVAGPVPGTPPAAVVRPRTRSRLTRILKTQQVGRVATGAGRWFLRTALVVLAALFVVGIILLVGAAFALGAVAEQSLTRQQWVFDNIEPGFHESLLCADLANNVSQTLQPYTLDALTDVGVVCRSPDTVELSARFRGAPVSTQVRVQTVKGVPAIRWERLNNVPLYVVGGIVSDGVNRGLVKVWANAPVVLDTFSITETAIEVTYGANPTVPARTP
ncbi:MAG: serine/threonine protein kinase, partial [Chloroflexi bacterium]|nr:serine/threonine protein kinase [Chloroflexota bacterium]